MIAALFVRSDSVYKNLGVDCWDIDRDAAKYSGPDPVICHPPCRAWGNFQWSAKPRPGEKQLAILSVFFVRAFGGVLEHPRTSKLWPVMKLPTGTDRDEFGGFSLHVDQHWWGHEARKRTMLYIVGIEPKEIPPYPLKFDPALKCVTNVIRNGKAMKEISKADRERTPIEFAKWLIAIAELCKQKKKINADTSGN